MYEFVFTFDVHSDEALTVDEISDLIEHLIDALDDAPAIDANISTTKTDQCLEVEVTISLEAANSLQAQRAGLATIMRAFTRADISVHDFPLEDAIVSSATKVLTTA